jgi:hypothetical protein
MKRTIAVVCSALVAVAVPTAAQRRAPGAQKPTTNVTIALKTGADTYQFAGQARCTHAPVASIYDLASEQWSVEQSDGARSLHLTVWKPKSGSGQMFTLSVSSAGRSLSVNTVKASGAPAPSGSGNVTLAAGGAGGTFTLDAKDARGAAITGTIKCDAFLPAIAEGGD